MTTQSKRRRIDTLNDEEKATFGPYAAKWIEHGQKTGPMSDKEWEKVQAAIRRVQD